MHESEEVIHKHRYKRGNMFTYITTSSCEAGWQDAGYFFLVVGHLVCRLKMWKHNATFVFLFYVDKNLGRFSK